MPITLKSNDYVLGAEKLTAVSASASKDAAGTTHISLVNVDAKASQDINVDIRGSKFTSVTGSILTSEKLQDYNSFEAPDKIKPAVFNKVVLSGSTLKVTLPAHSVVVLELK